MLDLYVIRCTDLEWTFGVFWPGHILRQPLPKADRDVVHPDVLACPFQPAEPRPPLSHHSFWFLSPQFNFALSQMSYKQNLECRVNTYVFFYIDVLCVAFSLGKEGGGVDVGGAACQPNWSPETSGGWVTWKKRGQRNMCTQILCGIGWSPLNWRRVWGSAGWTIRPTSHS